jgi:hypothetical protein
MHGPELGASTGGYADLPTMWSLLPMLSRSSVAAATESGHPS